VREVRQSDICPPFGLLRRLYKGRSASGLARGRFGNWSDADTDAGIAWIFPGKPLFPLVSRMSDQASEFVVDGALHTLDQLEVG